MTRKRCKVDDAITKYNLTAPTADVGSLDDYLVDRWIGADDYQAIGYRPLAEWFNKRLLKHVYDVYGRSTIGTRIKSDYEALTGDDDLVREEVIGDLEADGIDAESLIDDMVSPRTMHRHLDTCLDAEKKTPDAQTDWERESVDKAREQLERKVTKAARSLASKGEFLGADEADIDIEIYFSCPKCTTRVPFEVGRHQGYVCKEHFGTPPKTDVSDERAKPIAGASSVVEAVGAFVT